MHYTSIENIHKVIDPLFLNDLRSEFNTILEEKVERQRNRKLESFQDKLSSLTFFDPACGSGNFLTETYLSLRRLENEVIRERYHGQSFLGFEEVNPIKVNIGQFYGIEINDFAVTVATTALWISEDQMLAETEQIIHQDIDFLPLKTYTNIVEGNALRVDWESVVPKDHLSYIIGNPPFVGYSLQSKEQKEDILSVFVDVDGKPFKTSGKIDYVAGWYYKASSLMQHTSIKAALVSTNSITQGEQVAAIWKPLKELFNTHIDFAYRTFRWDSEASLKAHVHCVIVGFSTSNDGSESILYEGEHYATVNHINGYLIDAPDVYIESRQKPLCNVPQMSSGGKPVEGGYLIFTDEEKNEFIEKEPLSEQFMRRFVGSDDYINGKLRWCLWLVDASPKDLRSMPHVMQRVNSVREYRLTSTKEATRKCADTPTRFMEVKQPAGRLLIVPEVSSERRRYIPLGYMTDVICSNKVRFVPEVSLYHFGILTSNVHMAWMRVVCGRLKSDYSYSVNIVYNNFPWPTPTGKQREKIEQTAQTILDARSQYPESSLADLYDEAVMPPVLRKAHQANDRAVMEAYGFPVKNEFTESLCVAELFKLYQELTK